MSHSRQRGSLGDTSSPGLWDTRSGDCPSVLCGLIDCITRLYRALCAVVDTKLFELADDRELAWSEFGVRGGAPVVAFHGSPGTRYHFASLNEVAARRNTRLIAPDRPGYGHSTFDPARSYESWARDVGQLADHLGIDRFAVIGHSSGGPNAAGCARFLGDRLVGCAILSGPAPPEANISKHEMMRSNRLAQRIAPVAPRLMSAVVGAGLRQGSRASDKALAWMSRTLPACDVAVIERPEIHAALRDDLARALSRTAGRAAVQDLQLELRPWGFRLRQIPISVHVWHGDADRNVVVENGIYQANEIPDTTLHQVPHEGHWLHYDHFDEILDDLTS
jgi:pimeloyl-ACP methyl ester carboxylesterase